jgi:hypothetical protein
MWECDEGVGVDAVDDLDGEVSGAAVT